MLRKLKNFIHGIVGWLWVLRCGYPAKGMTVIGVTGTDGKTTTCTLIYEILKAAGIKVGLVTTVGAYIGDEETDTGLHVTNPGPELLQPLLKRMKEAGIIHVVLEVTSHGLDQNRVVGCNFKIGILTNITHEHLDYHKSMEVYREVKARLFHSTQYSVLNKDDDSYEYIKSKCGGQVISYEKTKLVEISPALGGDHNKYNIAAAVEVAKIFEVDNGVVSKVIRDYKGVKGRREEIEEGQNFRVIVDFAHTPNALEQTLKSLKAEKTQKTQRLIVVFGCPGKRDKSKRPLMGQAAIKYADRVIVTADDPRNEDLGEIFKQINVNAERIDDRREAIKSALKEAKAGDIVLLAGKGHEKSLAVGDKEIPWSDQETAKEILGVIK